MEIKIYSVKLYEHCPDKYEINTYALKKLQKQVEDICRSIPSAKVEWLQSSAIETPTPSSYGFTRITAIVRY